MSIAYQTPFDMTLACNWLSVVRSGATLETFNYQVLALNCRHRCDAQRIARNAAASLSRPDFEDHTDGEFTRRDEFARPLSDCFAIVWLPDLRQIEPERAPNPYRVLVVNIINEGSETSPFPS